MTSLWLPAAFGAVLGLVHTGHGLAYIWSLPGALITDEATYIYNNKSIKELAMVSSQEHLWNYAKELIDKLSYVRCMGLSTSACEIATQVPSAP